MIPQSIWLSVAWLLAQTLLTAPVLPGDALTGSQAPLPRRLCRSRTNHRRRAKQLYAETNDGEDDDDNNNTPVQNLQAAVLVPGLLTSASDFAGMAAELTHRHQIPTLVVPMLNWHWAACLGGRSFAPMLERLDFAVQWWAALHSQNDAAALMLPNDTTPVLTMPAPAYTLLDLWHDLQHNPGGVQKVGGSAEPDQFPLVRPRGTFPRPPNTNVTNKIALIGHSTGGAVARIYLSSRPYGGHHYQGAHRVHSLVTLGTPHQATSHAAFASVRWCAREEQNSNVRQLAVAGTGYAGTDWGAFTQNSYALCCHLDSDGRHYDGDGITPVPASLGWPGAEHMMIPDCTHFPWSDVWGAHLVAPELTAHYRRHQGSWYGSPEIVDQWAPWLKMA